MVLSQDLENLHRRGTLTPLSAETLRAYRSSWNLFQKWAGNRELDLDSAQEFIHYLLEIGRKPNTVARHGHALRRFLQEAGYDDRKLLLPSEEDQLPDYLTLSEVTRVLGACETPAERAIVMVLIESALRIGELLSLRDEHIRPGWIYADRTKTGYPGWVPCRGGAWDSLQAYLRWREPSPDGRVFPYLYKETWTWIKDIGRRAGLEEKLHPHLLRHTAAMLRRQQGASLSDLADLMGHKNLSTTRKYERLLPTELEKVIRPVWPEPQKVP